MHDCPSAPQPGGPQTLLLHCWLQHTLGTPHGEPSGTQVGGPQTLLLHWWLQHTSATPHGEPSPTQAPEPVLDAAALLAEDELVVVAAPVVVEGSAPVDDAATPPALALLTALRPPCPPAPLPAEPLEKRSSPPRPQAGSASALARSRPKRSKGREAGIVTAMIAKKRPADKPDRDPGHYRRRMQIRANTCFVEPPASDWRQISATALPHWCSITRRASTSVVK